MPNGSSLRLVVSSDLEPLLTAFLDEQAYRGNTRKTLGWYSKVFGLLMDFGVNSAEGLTRASVVAFIAHCRERGLSPATLQNYDRALRVALTWLYRNGYLAENPLGSLPSPKGKAKQVEPFTLDEVGRILEVAKTKSRFPLRDVALILLLLDTGVRAGEAVNLCLRDIDWQQGLMKVDGKTGERWVPFGLRCRRGLLAYLNRERKAPTPNEQAVFLVGGHCLQSDGLNRIITRIVRAAGIARAKVGPHTFRHTFAVEFLRAGGDVFTLQRILGHKKLEITQGYVNLLTQDVKGAHSRFSPVDRLI